MAFDAFLQAAWNDHGDRPGEVADRLEASLHVVDAAEHVPPFARLVSHVFGEHLGQWQRGIHLLEGLRALPAFDGSPSVAGSVAQAIATLRHAGGDGAALEGLGPDARISVLAAASSAFTGRGEFAKALGAYFEALRLAGEGLPAASPANRALAVGGNNLAAVLEAKQDRDAPETAGMIVAAESGLKYWKVAGTWLEEERAEYRLARSLLQAGRAAAAVASAQRCVDLCAANDAPPFEQFFGHAVLALAQRAAGDAIAFESARKQALHLLARVPVEDRPWCESECRELDA